MIRSRGIIAVIALVASLLLCGVACEDTDDEPLDLKGVEMTYELSLILTTAPASTVAPVTATSTASVETTETDSTASTSAPEPSNMTTVEPTTPEPPRPGNDTLDNLAQWLVGRYEWNTTGFLSLSRKWIGSDIVEGDTLKYNVTYDMELVDLTANKPATSCNLYAYELQRELCLVSGELSKWEASGWVISEGTDQSSEIENVGTRLDKGCDEYGRDVCASDFICYIEETEETKTKAMCWNKCKHFQDVEGHCTKNFIASGECKIIGENYDSYPYCDCGGWALMDDYYDGKECISASFIVGMAAGLGALVLVVLISVIICLALDRNDKAKQLEKAKYHTGSNSFDAPPKSAPNGAATTELTSHQQPKGMTEEDYEPEDYDDIMFHSEPPARAHKQAFDNKAYEHTDRNDVHRDKGLAELYNSEAFVNFEPNLGHVDPERDYSIKRPNIVVRPTGSYTPTRGSDWDRL